MKASQGTSGQVAEGMLVGAFDHRDGHVTHLRVNRRDGRCWVTFSRTTIVGEIHWLNATYLTYYRRNVASLWAVGAQLRVIEVNGKKFLRTDENQTPCDNLARLPSIAQFRDPTV